MDDFEFEKDVIDVAVKREKGSPSYLAKARELSGLISGLPLWKTQGFALISAIAGLQNALLMSDDK